jgi:hypothetical protein
VAEDEGRGDQKVFILSTPTLALPHRRGRALSRRFKISFVNLYRVYNHRVISKYPSGKHITSGDAIESPSKEA